MRALYPDERTRLAVICVGAAAVLAAVVAIRGNALALTIAWSTLMIASFVGWGSLVNFWLARDRWMDWGMRAGWGMALALSTGGYLSLLHVAVRPVLIAQVIVGIGVLLWTWVIRRPPALSSRRFAVLFGRVGVVTVVLGAYAIAAFTFCAYLAKQDFQPSDDPPLYFVLPKQILATGSLYEPFMARRISTLGGQPYLHALFLALAPFYYLHVVDAGIALVLTVALLVGHVARAGLKSWHAVPLGFAFLLLFTLINVRINTASELSGVPVILTLYRTVRVPLGPDVQPAWPIPTRRLVALATLAVVGILMRTSNAPALMPFLLLVLTSDFALATRQPWRPAALVSFASVLAIFSVAFAVALLPWAVMLKQSCGTFFYPFGHSNLTPGWTFLRTASLKQAAVMWLTAVSWDKPITAFIPFIVAGLAPLAGRARNDLVFLTVGCLVGIAALARQAGAFDAYNLARYDFAYVVATALLAAASVERSGPRAALIAVGIAVHVASSRDEMRVWYVTAVDSVSRVFSEEAALGATFALPTAHYTDIQSHIVPGATVVTAVHEPWRFDFKRNKIFTLDVLGGTGPKPGWPAFLGAQALAEYLKANGVRYVVFTEFDQANELYNRAHWRAFLNNDSFLGGEAPFQLDGMDAIDKLASLRRVVYHADAMTLVDLDSPR
jgi:hypothetical protein